MLHMQVDLFQMMVFWNIFLFLFFSSKQDVTIHANCLLRRQYVWQVKSFFFFFFQKTGFDNSCKLSPQETVWMKCQILFPGKNKKKHEMHSIKVRKVISTVRNEMKLSTLVMLNKDATPTSNFQPIRLFNPDCWYKVTYWMTNCSDPELIWIYTVCKSRVYLGYIQVQQDKG